MSQDVSSEVSWAQRNLPRVGFGLAVAVMAVVPLLRGRDFVTHDGTVLMPDLKETQFAAMAAQGFHQMTGAWSRLGLYPPGPMWFYVAALPLSSADQHPSGLVLAAAVVVSVSLVCAAVALSRGAGYARGLVGLLALAGAFHQLGLKGLVYPWNPTVIIVPTTAAVVCAAWCLARRTVVGPVLVALLGSFIAQAHLGALALGLVLVAIAGIGVWIHGDLRSRSISAAAMGLVLLVCWAPVARDQVWGSGNAGAVAKYAATGEVAPRFPPEPPSKALDLSIPSATAHLAEVTALTSGDTASWGGAEFLVGLEHSVTPVAVATFLGLLALCVVASEPRRFRPRNPDAYTTWLARVILVCIALELLASIRARGEFRYYLVASSAGVGAAMWVCAALVVMRFVLRTSLSNQRERLRVPVAALSAIGVLLLVLPQLGAASARFDYQDDEGDPVVAKILELSDGASVGLEIGSPFLLDQAQRLGLAVKFDGGTVAAGKGIGHRFSDVERRSHADLVAVSSPPGASPPECEVIGMFRDAEVCVRAAAK